MLPSVVIALLVLCCAAEGLVIVALDRQNDKMMAEIRELRHENARLEIDNRDLASRLSTAMGMLNKKVPGQHT